LPKENYDSLSRHFLGWFWSFCSIHHDCLKTQCGQQELEVTPMETVGHKAQKGCGTSNLGIIAVILFMSHVDPQAIVNLLACFW
jgi:hypothetical protein